MSEADEVGIRPLFGFCACAIGSLCIRLANVKVSYGLYLAGSTTGIGAQPFIGLTFLQWKQHAAHATMVAGIEGT
jgi:hypothetical protein